MSTGVSTLASPSTLVGQLWPSRDETRFAVIRAALLVLAGSLMLTVSAKISVPFYPVPMTMQTLVVLLIGATYGLRLGAATVAAYLLQGLSGLPVFAGAVRGPGLHGWTDWRISRRVPRSRDRDGLPRGARLDRSSVRIAGMMAIGHSVIFAFGLGWLAFLMPLSRAWDVGAAPFVAATVLKTALAVAALQAAWSFVQRDGPAR